MRFRYFGALCLSAVSLALGTGAPTLQAQTTPQITRAVNPAVRIVRTASVPVQVRSATDLGRVTQSLPMKDMILRLKPSKEQAQAASAFLEELQKPSSPSYHKWLTSAEFGSRFGVGDADLAKVTDWLKSSGFSVTEVSEGRRWIRFAGAAGQVEQAFRTEIHSYNRNDATHYANAAEISVPEALAAVISGPVTLNNFEKAPQHTPVSKVVRNVDGKLVRAGVVSKAASRASTSQADTSLVLPSDSKLSGPHSLFTTGGSPEQIFLAPGDFAKIYNTQPLLTSTIQGKDVSIAIVGRSDISISDVESFRTVFGLPFNDPTVLYANDDPGVIPGDDEEAILDVEWSGAVAPKAKINYVVGSSTTTTDGVDIAASYIVDHMVAPIMSVSFGICEQAISQDENDFYHDLWQQAAAEGITVFVSTGDSGSSGCDIPSVYFATPYGLGVNALASTPYNVAVGGTEFADRNLNTYWNLANDKNLSSAKGYVPEAVWNESCNPALPTSLSNCYFNPEIAGSYAGGGGASSCSVHPDDSNANIITGLYACQSGYPKPSWQVARGVPQDGVRDLPDVSLAAAGGHDGYLICYDGSCQYKQAADGTVTLLQASVIGGTSASSPSMAGVMALVEQENGTFQGQADHKLYELAGKQNSAKCDSGKQTDPSQKSTCVFHDITAGSNSLSCVFGRTDCTVSVPGVDGYGLLPGYPATAGYDLASGLGSVDVANLSKAWGALSTSATETTLTVSRTSFPHGSTVTVSSHVLPESGSGVPTGDITFKADGAHVQVGPLFAETLTSGRFSGPISSLPGGTYNLTSLYGGDGTFDGSVSDPVSLTVTPESSVLTGQTFAKSQFFILGRQPIVPRTATGLGGPFFLQVDVAGASGAGVATGNIVLTEHGNAYGTYPLDHNGSVYIQCGPSTPCDLARGNYIFNAVYSGDSSFASGKTSLPFTITRGSVNYFATVSSQTPPVNTKVLAKVYFDFDPVTVPTGLVTLTRDDTGAVLGSAMINEKGVANIPFIAAAGDYFIVPSYAGDANYKAGILRSYPEVAPTETGSSGTVIQLTTSGEATTIGSSTRIDVAVRGSNGNVPVPTGTVTLHTNTGLQTAPLPLVNGRVSGALTWNTAGLNRFYATYDGDAHYAGSRTPATTVKVNKGQPALALQARTLVVTKGTQASVTALITTGVSADVAAQPTGVVQFFDSVNGMPATKLGAPQPVNVGNNNSIVATLALALPEGSHTITASYLGDSNWKEADAGGAATVQVQ